MKGYLTQTGYMGFLEGKWRLFTTEADYREAYEEFNS